MLFRCSIITLFLLCNFSLLASLDSLISLAEAKQYVNPKEAEKITKEILVSFQKGEVSIEKAKTNRILSTALLNQDKISESLPFLSEALNITLQLKDKKFEASIRNDLAVLYQNLNMYDKSLAELFYALEINYENDNKFGISANLINIGGNYAAINQYSKALFWYNKAIENAVNPSQKAGVLSNIAAIKVNQAHYEEALKMHFQAIELLYQEPFKIRQAESYTALAETYKKINKIDSAKYYLQVAHDIFKEKDKKYQLAKNSLSLSKLFQTDDYNESREYLNKCISLAYQLKSDNLLSLAYLQMSKLKKDNESDVEKALQRAHFHAKSSDDISLILNSEKQLSEFYRAQGKSEEALKYLISFQNIQDSLNSLSKLEEIKLLEANQLINEIEKDFAKRDLESKLQMARNLRNLLIISLSALLIIISFLTYGYFEKKRYNKLLMQQAEKIALQNERLEVIYEKVKQYLYVNSHEVRKPIANLLGLMELTKISKDEEELKKLREAMLESVNELDKTLHQLNDDLLEEEKVRNN
jgi:tetratricopeptide (TPR) repeat protein